MIESIGMREKIMDLWNKKPLTIILGLALFFRLLAVFFSKGFGMHDDHFLVIEAAQSWVDGTDYNSWLPGSSSNAEPTGHSWFYPGLHFILFNILEILGIVGATAKMYVVRFLHAMLSMVTVILCYRIAEMLSNRKTAITVGLLIALLWFFPFMSVRNLAEFVSIIPLVVSTWLLIKHRESHCNWYYVVLLGFIAGLAISVRLQTILFVGGMGLALLLQKQFYKGIFFGVGVVLSVVLFQGGIDYYIWGYPFAELQEYIRYNIANAYSYSTNPWYTYFLLIMGVFIPPISLFILFGYARCWRKHLMLFLPSLIFLAFHCYFPNKQERFILPIMPFVITLGIIGWNDFVDTSSFWKRNATLLKTSWVFFWTINLILLPVISTMYSKRARVESMLYLSDIDTNIKRLLLEDSNHDEVKMVPRFYLNHQWPSEFEVSKSKPWIKFEHWKNTVEAKEWPEYALLFEDKNLKNRVDSLKDVFPTAEYLGTIKPSFVDNILYKLNKRNANQVIYIYKLKR